MQPVLDRWHIRISEQDILAMWNAPHRKYHAKSHLRDLLKQIDADTATDEREKDILRLAAIFHDILYDPTRTDNEEESARFFLAHCNNQESPDIQHIHHIILDTKTHEPRSHLATLFCAMDMSVVLKPYDGLLTWEEGIRYEYSHLPDHVYRQQRIAFLRKMVAAYPQNAAALTRLMEHVGSSGFCKVCPE